MNQNHYQISSLGRLGNQMFIYAFIRKLIHERNGTATIIVPPSVNRLNCFCLSNKINFATNLKYNIRQRLGIFIYQCMTRGGKHINQISDIERSYQKLFSWFRLHLSQESCLEPLSALNNAIILGYFQSENCFASIKNQLQEEFRFSDKIILRCENLAQYITQSNSCCIHIRRGDYLESEVFGVCTDSYYREAISQIRKNINTVKFFVFSDDIEDVKKTFSEFLGPDTCYIPADYTDQESMYLGSLCKHFIISNSTFSWWMQYLSENASKKVYAPSRWYNDGRDCHIYQSNWTLINP